MLRKKSEGVEWLEFELLAEIPSLRHGVFLRHGGVSQPPFDSLNVGGGTGDDLVSIERNRSLVAKILGVESLVSGKQAHETNLLNIPTNDPLLETSCDALFTEQPSLALLIKHADCQAALFYNPMQKKIGAVHCGWRGNVQNIYAKAVAFMGGNPADLLVCISPSLGPKAAEFKNYKTELPASFLPFKVGATNHFDLWATSRSQLEEAGVLPHHIQIAEICTFAHPEDFFSYRRDKVCGRNGTVILRVKN